MQSNSQTQQSPVSNGIPEDWCDLGDPNGSKIQETPPSTPLASQAGITQFVAVEPITVTGGFEAVGSASDYKKLRIEIPDESPKSPIQSLSSEESIPGPPPLVHQFIPPPSSPTSSSLETFHLDSKKADAQTQTETFDNQPMLDFLNKLKIDRKRFKTHIANLSKHENDLKMWRGSISPIQSIQVTKSILPPVNVLKNFDINDTGELICLNIKNFQEIIKNHFTKLRYYNLLVTLGEELNIHERIDIAQISIVVFHQMNTMLSGIHLDITRDLDAWKHRVNNDSELYDYLNKKGALRLIEDIVAKIERSYLTLIINMQLPRESLPIISDEEAREIKEEYAALVEEEREERDEKAEADSTDLESSREEGHDETDSLLVFGNHSLQHSILDAKESETQRGVKPEIEPESEVSELELIEPEPAEPESIKPERVELELTDQPQPPAESELPSVAVFVSSIPKDTTQQLLERLAESRGKFLLYKRLLDLSDEAEKSWWYKDYNDALNNYVEAFLGYRKSRALLEDSKTIGASILEDLDSDDESENENENAKIYPEPQTVRLSATRPSAFSYGRMYSATAPIKRSLPIPIPSVRSPRTK